MSHTQHTESKESNKLDWQSERLTIQESISFWFNNELLSDVTFRIKENTIPAHKFVLASRSSVFFAMLYGPAANLGKDTKEVVPEVITITDCQNRECFLEFLRFLYTDNCGINWSNVFTLMPLADKYFVQGLLNACGMFLEGKLSVENVISAFKGSLRYRQKDLEKRCLLFI